MWLFPLRGSAPAVCTVIITPYLLSCGVQQISHRSDRLQIEINPTEAQDYWQRASEQQHWLTTERQMRQQIDNRTVFTVFVYVFYRKKLLHQTYFYFIFFCLPACSNHPALPPQVGWHANRAATQEEKPGRSYRTQQLFCCTALFIIHLIWKTDCKPTAQLSSSNKARAQIIHDAAKKRQQDERGQK